MIAHERCTCSFVKTPYATDVTAERSVLEENDGNSHVGRLRRFLWCAKEKRNGSFYVAAL